MRFLKSLLFLLIFFLFSLIFQSKTFAEDNFTTDYAVTYQVNDSASTHAIFNITLTNLSSQYYASSYKIEVGFGNITHVLAKDSGGMVKTTITETPNGHEIGMTFNDKVVGKGKQLHFTIEFDTSDIATKSGQIWEINIPGIANQSDFSAFTVSIQTPPDFGKPTFIKPPQPTDTMTFTKDMLGKSGISISYGDKQVYAFHLTYHLRNDNLFPVRTEIALPPQTNYQNIFIDSIQPQPTNVTIDPDGNWLASYTLQPSLHVDVVAAGTSELFLTPKKSVLSKDQYALYTKPQPYWDDTSGNIKKISQGLKTPRAIFDYVVKTLSYDYTRVIDSKPRLGAKNILQNPTSAVCLEFTDLFIALARAANIPAREVDGFAYTQNTKERPLSLLQDILHAWPEYYDTDKQAWIMVDPTWANTTGGIDYFNVLDFDHFAFAIKGVSSSYPVPAGGYKFAGDEKKKDVEVVFSDNIPSDVQKLSLMPDFSEKYLAGLPIHGQITVKNVGETVTQEQNILVRTGTFLPREQSVATPQIPPFGQVTLPVTFNALPFLTNSRGVFTMSLASSEISRTIQVSSFLTIYPYVTGGIIIVLLTLIISLIAYKTWRVYVSRQRK